MEESGGIFSSRNGMIEAVDGQLVRDHGAIHTPSGDLVPVLTHSEGFDHLTPEGQKADQNIFSDLLTTRLGAFYRVTLPQVSGEELNSVTKFLLPFVARLLGKLAPEKTFYTEVHKNGRTLGAFKKDTDQVCRCPKGRNIRLGLLDNARHASLLEVIIYFDHLMRDHIDAHPGKASYVAKYVLMIVEALQDVCAHLLPSVSASAPAASPVCPTRAPSAEQESQQEEPPLPSLPCGLIEAPADFLRFLTTAASSLD